MKNKLLFNMQAPFNGAVVSDESKLKSLFGDEYDSLVKLEADIKTIDPNYYGDGKPFVLEGFFFKYPDKVEDKIWMVTTTGNWKYILKSDFENQVNEGIFDGLPMHKGHTNYPEDQTDFKEPFGSSIKTEVRSQGGYGYYYILPSEGKLRKDLATSAVMGFQKAPLRDLSSQFMSFASKEDTERVIKVNPSSIDLVYKKQAFLQGSGFQSIVANQKPNIEEENIMLERKSVLNTLTIEEMKGNENGKAVIAKLQADARADHIKKDEIVKAVENDSTLRGEVVKCQKVIDDFKSADVKLQEKKTDFEKKGLEFLQQKKVPEDKAKTIIADFGENMEYDVAKLQGWLENAEKMGFQFQAKGASAADDLEKKPTGGITEEAAIGFVNSL